MRNYTPYPHTYLDEMKDLSDKEYGALCKAMHTYSITGKPIEKKDLPGKAGMYAERVMTDQDKFKAMDNAIDELDLDEAHEFEIEDAASDYIVYGILPPSIDENLDYVLSKIQQSATREEVGHR